MRGLLKEADVQNNNVFVLPENLTPEQIVELAKQPLLADPFSRSVSRFVSEHVRNNPTWRYVSTMPGPFGPVTVYENGRR